MITLYDFDKFVKDYKISKVSLAKRVGISKQLLGYHLSKGDINLSMAFRLADEAKIPICKVISLLNKDYIKKSI